QHWRRSHRFDAARCTARDEHDIASREDGRLAVDRDSEDTCQYRVSPGARGNTGRDDSTVRIDKGQQVVAERREFALKRPLGHGPVATLVPPMNPERGAG